MECNGEFPQITLLGSESRAQARARAAALPLRSHARLLPHRVPRPASEKDAELAQKLGQPSSLL
jgi:hypothetical protein